MYILVNLIKKTINKLPGFFLLLLVMFPLIILAIYTSYEIFNDFNKNIFSRRQAITFLVTSVVSEKLDRVIDVGISLSTNAQFKKLIENNKWDEAIKMAEQLPNNFSYITLIAIYNTQGILKTITPLNAENLAAIGKDFSYRDYYQGVNKNWKPYIGEAIKPAVPLGYNLIPVAIPILSDSGNKIGIMNLIIELDAIAQWFDNIDIGTNGLVYLVDQKGNLIAHPTLLPAEDIVDFSSVPVVQKVLRGEKGVEILWNPIENERRLTSYEQIPKYGWGVIIGQSTDNAFAGRNKTVGIIVSIWILIILITFITYRSLRDKKVIKVQRDREKALLENISDGVIATDLQGKITLINKAAETMFGRNAENIIDKLLYNVIILENEKGNFLSYKNWPTYLTPNNTTGSTYYYVRKDKTKFPITIEINPIINDNKIIGSIGVFRDITKEKEISQAKSEFVSLASHQLRTPLTSIKWFLEMLLSGEVGKLNKKQKEYFREIYQNNQRMITLVSALLNVSRIELGVLTVNPEPIKIITFIKEILKGFKTQIQEKNLVIKEIYTPNLPLINIDSKLLSIVIQNIISNAIKYTAKKGTISVKTFLREDKESVGSNKLKTKNLVIIISDTGYGIPRNQYNKIFTKLFRADNVKEKDTDGTGLGLYLAKLIIKHIEGYIWFESKLNKGTTFYITIPIEGIKKIDGTKQLNIDSSI